MDRGSNKQIISLFTSPAHVLERLFAFVVRGIVQARKIQIGFFANSHGNVVGVTGDSFDIAQPVEEGLQRGQ